MEENKIAQYFQDQAVHHQHLQQSCDNQADWHRSQGETCARIGNMILELQEARKLAAEAGVDIAPDMFSKMILNPLADQNPIGADGSFTEEDFKDDFPDHTVAIESKRPPVADPSPAPRLPVPTRAVNPMAGKPMFSELGKSKFTIERWKYDQLLAGLAEPAKKAFIQKWKGKIIEPGA